MVSGRTVLVLHAFRVATPLAFGFVLGSVLSLAVFPLVREYTTVVVEDECLQTEPEETFEAIIRPAVPKERLKNESKTKVVRPRFYATELNIKDKLFVAVLTSPDTVQALAVALNKTASHHVSKMVFFSDNAIATPDTEQLHMNLVHLHMSAHDKIFHVVDYIVNKKLVENYDWFFVMPDNVYLKAFKLHELVTHMSVGTKLVMGHKADQQPKWCDIESGVLLSNKVISQIAENWQTCNSIVDRQLDQTVNFGRCVHGVLDFACNDEINGKSFKSWRLENGDERLESDLELLRNQDSFNGALSIHPVTSEASIYLLHKHHCQLELEQLSVWTETIKSAIHSLAVETEDGPSWPAGLPDHWKPKNRYEVFKWDFFTETEIFRNEPGRNVRPLQGIDKKDINSVVVFAQKHVAERRPDDDRTFERLLGGYRLFDPTRGMDYVVDLVYKSATDEETRRVHLVRPLTRAEIINDVPYVTEDSNLTIILPVPSSDLMAAQQFLVRFGRHCIDQNDKRHTRLVLALTEEFGAAEAPDQFTPLIRALSAVKDKCRGNNHFSILHLPKMQYYSTNLKESVKVLRLDPSSDILDVCLLHGPWNRLDGLGSQHLAVSKLLGWAAWTALGLFTVPGVCRPRLAAHPGARFAISNHPAHN